MSDIDIVEISTAVYIKNYITGYTLFVDIEYPSVLIILISRNQILWRRVGFSPPSNVF